MLLNTIPNWVESQSKLEFNSPRAQKIHKGIFEMNILDCQPWTMVNDPGFIRLMNVLEPRFEIASDKYYREKLAPSFLAVKTKLMETLEKDNSKTISVSLDGWSAFHHGYLGINCHYISDWKRKKLNLACKPFDDSHTGVNIYNCLEEVLTEWEILQKTKVALRDNAPNMVLAFNLERSTIDGIGCLNHTLQLVIGDELFSKESIKTLIAKARKICTHASHSVAFSRKLDKKQKQLMDLENTYCLVGDSITRWNR